MPPSTLCLCLSQLCPTRRFKMLHWMKLRLQVCIFVDRYQILSPSPVELTDKQHTSLMALQYENWDDTLEEDMDDSENILLPSHEGELDELLKMQNHIFERWVIFTDSPLYTISNHSQARGIELTTICAVIKNRTARMPSDLKSIPLLMHSCHGVMTIQRDQPTLFQTSSC